MLYKNLSGIAISLAIGIFSGNSHAWVVKIDCNEGKNGVKVTESSALNNFGDAAGRTEYTSEQYVEGGMGCKMQIEKGSVGWANWGGRKNLPTKLYKGSEIWVRVHTFFPEEFDYDSDGEGSKVKFLRVHTMGEEDGKRGSCVGANEGYNDWYLHPTTKLFGDEAYGFIKECQGKWRFFGSFKNGISIKKGVWETYEMYLKLDNVAASNGGQGLVRVWRNEELLGEFRDIRTLMTSKSYAVSLLMFTYWNGGSPKSQHMYMDDLIVTNERPGSQDSAGNPRIGTGEIQNSRVLSSPPVSPKANIYLR